MPLVLHTKIEDDEFHKMVVDALQAEIKRIAREEIDNYIKEISQERAKNRLTDDYINNIISVAIKEELRKMFWGTGALNDMFQKIVREELNKVINSRLENGRLF